MGTKALHAVGLDAGATATRCVICIIENGRVRYAGHGAAASGGWSKGRVADQHAAAECVGAAVQQAERLSGIQVESAVVGIGGAGVRGGQNRGLVELGRPREIEQRDVNRAVNRASRIQLQEDRMLLQIAPQDSVVDDHPGHRDPRKMVASRLEVNVHVLTTSVQEHNAIVSAVNQAHISAEETVFEPLAACYAAVLPEDRREGVACLDIGSQSSGLAVYYGDSLQLATGIPICGDHFTRDVARGLHTSFEDALLIKEEFGCALAEWTSETSIVELPSIGDRQPREAPRRVLNQILEARADELFHYVHRELARVGMTRALIGGIVLTGGGAKLGAMCDLAERMLNCQARKGLAVGIQDWPEELQDPSWTSAAGLAMYSGRLKMQGELERRQLGLLGRILR
jgi:cell division protein FtsA